MGERVVLDGNHLLPRTEQLLLNGFTGGFRLEIKGFTLFSGISLT